MYHARNACIQPEGNILPMNSIVTFKVKENYKTTRPFRSRLGKKTFALFSGILVPGETSCAPLALSYCRRCLDWKHQRYELSSTTLAPICDDLSVFFPLIPFISRTLSLSFCFHLGEEGEKIKCESGKTKVRRHCSRVKSCHKSPKQYQTAIQKLISPLIPPLKTGRTTVSLSVF